MKAFTLFETLCVCIILGVLASFLVPAFQAVRHSALVSADLTRLHQLHTALMLYRTDHDGDGKWGTSSEMGLPDSVDLYEHGINLVVLHQPDMWKSPCGVHPDFERWAVQPVHYIYPPCNQELGCGEYYRKYQESSVLLIDKQCVSPDVPLYSPYFRKQIVGIRLNGQAQTLYTYRSPDLVQNWN